MKNKFKDTKLGKTLAGKTKVGRILGSILKGGVRDITILGASPIAGGVIALKEGFSKIIKEGKQDETGGNGNNWPRIIAMIVSFALIALFITGKLSKENLIFIFDLFENSSIFEAS